jgi:tetratricopeptide (TPR) repeat protein
MKRNIIISAIAGFLAITAVQAQTLQEGINHLYADRFQNAKNTFQKLISVNPNNIEAIYWLGQTYLDMDDNDAARKLYDDALMSSANAPLLIVGKGHVQLLDNKLSEARQSFETAITMSRSRKGEDPVILNAVASANIDAKAGDLKYAIEKLEIAAQRDSKNPDIYVNLGNAVRKYKRGESGGDAYVYYMKALEVNPNFVYAHLRLAKLFETQKNWDLVLQHLNEAVKKDPNFSLAYYELFYYYWWYKQDYDKSEEILKKYIASRPNEDHVEDDYLYSQLCWARKDYDCAIEKAESVARYMGAKIKPRVHRQLAYSYFGKKDYANAKKNIDLFFQKSKDGPIPDDFKLKADILSGMDAEPQEIFKVFVDGANADTVLQSKIEFLNKGVDFFRNAGNKCLEAEMRLVLYKTRPNPNPGDMFFIGLPWYQCGSYQRADSAFKIYAASFPDSIYGYFWGARANSAIDTAMDQGLAVPYYEKALEVAAKEPDRLKSFGIEAAGYLAGYHNNIKGDVNTAIAFIQKGLEIDSTNANLQNTHEILKKISQQQNQQQKKTPTSSKPTGKVNAPVKTAALKS